MKKKEFLKIAYQLNKKLNIMPLLFGSLGLEQRLTISLNAEDIDVLIPKEFINEKWQCIVDVMNDNGYTLYDYHEHAFEKDGLSLAYASIESLTPFADIDIANIPIINEDGIKYLLLELQDYLKVYTASSKDGYRKNVKNKQDKQKIDLIHNALSKNQYIKMP
ncbi:MAG: phosphoribosylanthranilate isomerase [Eubacterium sp.]|nr:phosphoribosylanthranilate isomerase [Eubacterium sp.]